MKAQPPRAELRQRLERYRALLARESLSAALITDPANVHYLSGFTGDDSALLITQRHRVLLTDFRFVEEGRASAPGWRIVIKPPGLMEKAGETARKLRIRRLGIEPAHLCVKGLSVLRHNARGVKVRRPKPLVEELRQIKSAWEVRQIEKALRIQEQCFNEVCRMLRPGMLEYDAAAELRYRLVRAGADDQAFPIMFQWGPNSSLPHGRPTSRKLKANSIILADFGARYAGYHADLTRTFFIGRIPVHLRRIHEVVAEAQKRAVASISPGVELIEVDKAARDFIKKAGYGKHFGHSTGHGLGLKVHESPTLSWRSKGKLAAGMVVTVEPGIYLPGAGGVRIEDDVLVTPKGRRVLSRLPVGLRWNGANK